GAARGVDHPGTRHQRESRGYGAVATPGLADRERAALGSRDQVTADEVAVREQPALDIRAPGHADAQDPAQAGDVVRMADLGRLVQRVGERQREYVAHDRHRVHLLGGNDPSAPLAVAGPARTPLPPSEPATGSAMTTNPFRETTGSSQAWLTTTPLGLPVVPPVYIS